MNLPSSIIKISDTLWVLDESTNNCYVAGNKIRKLNGIIPCPFRHKGILSFGSPYSSHLLACAWWAAYLKVSAVGVVIHDGELNSKDYPHLRAADLMGMKLVYADNSDARDIISREKNTHQDFLWIPGGGHTIDGSLQYTQLFDDLFKSSIIDKRITQIVLPYGTGTTAHGVWVSAIKHGIKVIGVSVARSKSRCLDALKDVSPYDSFDMLHIEDKYHECYGKRLDRFEKRRSEFFEMTSILVDPIYNAVAVTHMLENNMKNVLYVNTGGALNNLL